MLIQHGKGADAGAAFGSGSSSTVFGSQGSGSFLTKVTTFLAILFLANSLLLAHLSVQKIKAVPMSLLGTPATVVAQEEVATEVVVPDEESDGDHEGHGHDVPDLPIE